MSAFLSPLRALAAVLLIFLDFPALAQPARGVQEPVRVTLLHPEATLAGLNVHLAPGWKFYWRTPGEGGVPAEFDWRESGNLAEAHVDWPVPGRLRIGGVDIYGYENQVLLPVRLTPRDPGQPVTPMLRVTYGVCRDICLLREDMIRPEPVLADQADMVRRWQALVPVSLGQAGLPQPGIRVARTGEPALEVDIDHPAENLRDLFVEGPAAYWFGAPKITPSGRGARLRLPMNPQAAPAPGSLRFTLRLADTAVEFTQ